MPASLIKSFAQRAAVPAAKAEECWAWAKAQAAEKFKKKGPSYWAYVNALTQRRLGIQESNLRFSAFLMLVDDKYLQLPEQGSSDAQE